MDWFILVSYFSILSVLCIYGAHRLLITHWFHKNCDPKPQPKGLFDELPQITIQLPLFNEKFVVERLIEATCAIDYPKEKLHIQVLDDSTDETCVLAQDKVREFQKKGVDIVYIHRTNRVGFKAGALDEGLAVAKGDYVAIFDADFVPPANILHNIIHHFTDEKVGMVQTRWGHLNREFSTLTQVQSIMLDAHFMIEHNARCYSNCFFNFNGTAGMWRRAAIEEAGGWEHDTLTEDLDLSYRSQLKGWKFIFLPSVVCPAELPIEMKAFKSQQHRWAKGSIQVMKKLLPTIWRSPISWKAKLEATFHLTGNLAYLLMVINSVFFMIPAMMIRERNDWWQILFLDGPLFFLASISFIHFYLSSQRAVFGHTRGRRRFIPAIMAVGIGLGINNTRAVIEALMGKQSEFVRTPKLGERALEKTANNKRKTGYRLSNVGWGYLETGLGLLYTWAIIWAVLHGVWAAIPFFVLFQNGFLFIGLSTLAEEWQNWRVKLGWVRAGETS
jgi:cellulose synthase/poly-beta-1,6-N-acetylglucosamine synthase-like glycosyltransferase